MNCNRLSCYLGAAPGDSQPQASATSNTNKVLIILAIAVGALYLLSKRRRK